MTLTATRSGRRVDLLSPERSLIRASDMAEGLAKINRWSGATLAPFSVAQHSVYVANLMYAQSGPVGALYGILHDGHEYLIGDILESTSLALAVECPGYSRALRSLRFRVDSAIHRAFGLAWPRPPAIDSALDLCHARVVATEIRDVLAHNLKPADFAIPDHARAPVLDVELVSYGWSRAATVFREALDGYQVSAGLTPLE